MQQTPAQYIYSKGSVRKYRFDSIGSPESPTRYLMKYLSNKYDVDINKPQPLKVLNTEISNTNN